MGALALEGATAKDTLAFTALAEDTAGGIVTALTEDFAGGIEIMVASRPHPGALSLEMPGCPRGLPLPRVPPFPFFTLFAGLLSLCPRLFALFAGLLSL